MGIDRCGHVDRTPCFRIAGHDGEHHYETSHALFPGNRKVTVCGIKNPLKRKHPPLIADAPCNITCPTCRRGIYDAPVGEESYR